MELDLKSYTTEQVNDRTRNIDKLDTLKILELINDEDQIVAVAIKEVLPQISDAIDCIYQSIKNGGRLFYIGAGTSGRLGVLDAAECPPTFGTSPELVQAIIAGGEKAIFNAVEGAEDDYAQGIEDLKSRELNAKDVVVGITASGRTPYVRGGLDYTKQVGASAVALSCNKGALISENADYKIEVIVGPEILAGSTRLKAATAHKMILNMITTTTMIKLGKVYQNLMVDLNASNYKLIERARNIVIEVTGASYEESEKTLNETNQEVKSAIVMIEAGVPLEVAKGYIEKADGSVCKAIELLKNSEFYQIEIGNSLN